MYGRWYEASGEMASRWLGDFLGRHAVDNVELFWSVLVYITRYPPLPPPCLCTMLLHDPAFLRFDGPSARFSLSKITPPFINWPHLHLTEL